ncbi:unnamed protein product [Coccothraustes coccothraustes]
MAPFEMAPASPLRGGAVTVRAAATTMRPQGALPSSARADTKEVPGGSKPGAAGGAGPILAPRAFRPPPKAARPRCGASALPRSAAARSALAAPAIIPNRSYPWAQLPQVGAGRRQRPPRPCPWSAPTGAAKPALSLRSDGDRGHLKALSNSRSDDTSVSSTQRFPHSTADPTKAQGPRQPSAVEAPRQETQAVSHRCVTPRRRVEYIGGSTGLCRSPTPPPLLAGPGRTAPRAARTCARRRPRRLRERKGSSPGLQRAHPPAPPAIGSATAPRAAPPPPRWVRPLPVSTGGGTATRTALREGKDERARGKGGAAGPVSRPACLSYLGCGSRAGSGVGSEGAAQKSGSGCSWEARKWRLLKPLLVRAA